MSDRCIELSIGWVSHPFSLALWGAAFLRAGTHSERLGRIRHDLGRRCRCRSQEQMSGRAVGWS